MDYFDSKCYLREVSPNRFPDLSLEIDWNIVPTLLVTWGPVEASVIAVVVALYRKVTKLWELFVIVPRLTAEERLFARWWIEHSMREEMKHVREMLEPGKPAPWTR